MPDPVAGQGAWHSVAVRPAHAPEARECEWRGDAVIGTELEPDHRVDVVASLIGEDDHRDIGARPDVAQQVEPVVLAETQVEDRQVRLAQGEMAYHCLASRRAQSAHLVSLEIVHDHLPRDGVVNGDEDERR
ncbi:MAG TPA: hypothetical protein VJ349_14735 [Stellaceae bacterium]|nr:hypothetical protein [Stellaceae bacterium]